MFSTLTSVECNFSTTPLPERRRAARAPLSRPAGWSLLDPSPGSRSRRRYTCTTCECEQIKFCHIRFGCSQFGDRGTGAAGEWRKNTLRAMDGHARQRWEIEDKEYALQQR